MRRTKELVNNALLLYFSVLVMSIHCFSICDTSLATTFFTTVDMVCKVISTVDIGESDVAPFRIGHVNSYEI